MSRAIQLDGVPGNRPSHLSFPIAALRRLAKELDTAPTMAIRSLIEARNGAVAVNTNVLVAFMWAGLSVPERPGSEKYQWCGLTIEGVCEWLDAYCAAHPPLDMGQFLVADAVIEACYEAGLIHRPGAVTEDAQTDPLGAAASVSDSTTAHPSNGTSTIS